MKKWMVLNRTDIILLLLLPYIKSVFEKGSCFGSVVRIKNKTTNVLKHHNLIDPAYNMCISVAWKWFVSQTS